MSEQLSIGSLMVLPLHLTDGFDEFWAAYQHRKNDPKKTAREAWPRALRAASLREIMDGVGRYEFSADPQFRPMAATWLNQRRWQCERIDLALDSWGLGEWVTTLPASAALSAASYEIETLQTIMLTTELDATWRGPLDVLDGWLKDGFVPQSIAGVIMEEVKRGGVRNSLKAFDWRVRERAARMTK